MNIDKTKKLETETVKTTMQHITKNVVKTQNTLTFVPKGPTGWSVSRISLPYTEEEKIKSEQALNC